ncbi:hypothetical protein D210916BOD24_08530 [Alteromonas sp. D210916BOD_24]
MSGCVSQSQPGVYGRDFDPQEAAKTRMSLGLTYLQNNNYTQAKKNLDKALEFNPDSADVQYAMAYYYQLVGDDARAQGFYETALELAPNNGDIANSYGAFKCQLGEYESAKAYFFQAINSQRYANAAQTYENLALCAQSQGKIDEAINYFQDALKHQPTRVKSLFLLSELYVMTEQWGEASQTLQRYNKVAKLTADSLWLSYEIAKGQGDEAAAKGYGEMMVSLFPDDGLTQRYLAQSKAGLRKVITKQKSSEAGLNSAVSVSNAEETSVHSEQNRKITTQSAKIHVVKPGENLYRISRLHNIRMAKLQEWNNLSNSGAIIAGQTLWLVPPSEQEE